jgi:hypothetical protein
MSSKSGGLDRITFRDGQQLTSRDLNHEQERALQLRWLHTRYLHGVWGIAEGLEAVSLGEDAVWITPGYAIDHWGRELVLFKGAIMPHPALRKGRSYVLVLHAADVDPLGVCRSSKHQLGNYKPVLTWVPSEAAAFGPMVPIAQLGSRAETKHAALDRRVRRYTRREVWPYIATGETIPGETGWEDRLSDPRVVRAMVHTGSAGFLTVPTYFTEIKIPNSTGQSADPPKLMISRISYTHSSEFRIELMLIGKLSAAEAERRCITISWVGIEPILEC